MTPAAATVQAFFTERLTGQRRASGHTIAAYRDALRLLLGFAAERTRTAPCRLDFADLNAPLVAAFLDHLERERGNSIRTRNARLAAIRSLFAYAALRRWIPMSCAGSWCGPGGDMRGHPPPGGRQPAPRTAAAPSPARWSRCCCARTAGGRVRTEW